MAQPIVAKLARELAKFTKNKSKSKISDKLDASTKTYIKDEKVIDKQKLDEQEEIIRRLTK